MTLMLILITIGGTDNWDRYYHDNITYGVHFKIIVPSITIQTLDPSSEKKHVR